ncbi:Uncharacterised protein [uncultured archaeon]|nr:Uncharacterised protein [uncultured archaeon]
MDAKKTTAIALLLILLTAGCINRKPGQAQQCPTVEPPINCSFGTETLTTSDNCTIVQCKSASSQEPSTDIITYGNTPAEYTLCLKVGGRIDRYAVENKNLTACIFQDNSYCEIRELYANKCVPSQHPHLSYDYLTSCEPWSTITQCPDIEAPVCAKTTLSDTYPAVTWRTYKNPCEACLDATPTQKIIGYLQGTCSNISKDKTTFAAGEWAAYLKKQYGQKNVTNLHAKTAGCVECYDLVYSVGERTIALSIRAGNVTKTTDATGVTCENYLPGDDWTEGCGIACTCNVDGHKSCITKPCVNLTAG